MAATSRGYRPVRTLVTLGITVLALFATLLAGVQTSNATWTPKLALDLEGGTQIILTPIAADKAKITDATITQAINIIRQRVDSSGVAEAEITSQGGNNIVVALPGKPDSETLDLVRESAQMRFRPVLVVGAPAPVASSTATDGATPAPTDAATTPPTDSATTAPTDTATTAPTDAATTAPTDTAAPAASTDPSDLSWVTPSVQAAYDALDCSNQSNLKGGGGDDPAVALVTCETDGSAKYILGPVEMEGSSIKSASSGLKTGSNGVVTNEWVVNMQFTKSGGTQFAATTKRLAGLTSPRNQFAMVLDKLVISAPSVSKSIPDGSAEISGTFTRKTAANLANQLNFGALPLTFEVQSEQQISASLGSEQLQKGILAGLIGLLLVVVYSMFQYRALGFVTVASLILAAVITYGVISVLSWTQGYRLSLPGVAGLIVAIGITADSFIVYFERIRDELRDGRTLVGAVDKGWSRARRTIIASDAVNFLAAIVLYVLAVGGVRGFAFTLGLTTLIDLLIVFLFTHPLMTVLAKTSFFGNGHPGSGLDPRRLGVQSARYVGRGRVAVGAESTVRAASPAAGPGTPTGTVTAADVADPINPLVSAAPKQTIAERRAAARAAERAAAVDGVEGDAEGGASQASPPEDAPSGDPSSSENADTERNES